MSKMACNSREFILEYKTEVIFSKGGASVEDTTLFGKYQICRVIGTGRSGTVFLARHKTLDEYRAIKRVPKERCREDYYREALILKSLRHPGIPIIFDLEEDPLYFYLIEEYLEGESLFALLRQQGNLTKAKTISFGIELCQIMNYLHSLKPNPILYLDLQPKNLMICDGVLKLIDFDQAVTAPLAGELKSRYGTVGCAAPEQYTDEPLDKRTDIYAIGALLYYMRTSAFPDGEKSMEEKLPEDGLSAVIKRCLEPFKEDRYADAGSVLESLLKLRSGVFSENQISLLKIAVAGSRQGIGTTHAALELSSYLSRKGINNLYLEKNLSGDVMRIAGYFGQKPDINGIFHINGWDLKPRYGECVKLNLPRYEAVIEDFGSDLDGLLLDGKKELILLLCGGKWWEKEGSVAAIRQLPGKKGARVIFNHLDPKKSLLLPRDIVGLKYLIMPFLPDPGSRDPRMDIFWKNVLKDTPAAQALNIETTKNTAGERSVRIRKRLGDLAGAVRRRALTAHRRKQ